MKRHEESGRRLDDGERPSGRQCGRLWGHFPTDDYEQHDYHQHHHDDDGTVTELVESSGHR
jgi:hypothetical protein